MLFRRALHTGLIDGSITLTFRHWKRPQVKVGGRYRLAEDGALEVTALDRVTAATITDAEARRSGFDDGTALLVELGRTGDRPLRRSQEVFRVEFHYVRQMDERAELAASADLTGADVDGIARRLARMDDRSKRGPWTTRTLTLIQGHPRTAASRLAPLLGMETAPFKVNVRKLKAIGLSISLETGYALSPRGLAYLANRKT